MAKASSIFVCQNCGYESPKWMGQCSSCGEWNSLQEQISNIQRSTSNKNAHAVPSAKVLRFSEVKDYDRELVRLSSGMEEFDRVLGGGIVFGSVVLIGGEPGIGKSTLLTHLTINILTESKNSKIKMQKKVEQNLDEDTDRKKVLYVAGEESPEQISLRIQRMLQADFSSQKSAVSSVKAGSRKLKSESFSNEGENYSQNSNSWKDSLLFLTSTDVDEITSAIHQERPDLVIVDSIQTLSTQDLTGATGSIGQLKESTDRLTRTAKRLNIPIFLVGHVTKEGSIAGPKVLEHMVDSVLELSGERTGQYRLLRAVKNRFGATDEVGIFVHTDVGLEEVTNPSATFLEERVVGAPGSALVSVIEGTRPILIEVQALVVRSELPVPRRVARGIPLPRLQVIVAVLEKYVGVPLGQCDVFVNVAGGMTISEPAADLGIAVALASSYANKASAKDTIYIGEVGLLGEVRKVKLLDKRVKEAKRLGFGKVISAGQVKTVRETVAHRP